MAITAKDVARHAQVSESTAGMILSGRGQHYSVHTRERVLATARKLKYRPNVAGRSLRLQRSFLVGVLLNASNASLASEFLRGVQEGLQGPDGSGEYSSLVAFHTDCREQAECMGRMLDRGVDGLIVNAALDAHGRLDEACFTAARERGLPMVEVFGRFLAGVPQFNLDNRAAGQAATQHLLDLGHRRIAMLTHERYLVGRNQATHFDAWQRFEGYQAAMHDAGLEPAVVTHPITGEVDVALQFTAGGRDALAAIVAHPARPTAVVCYNDLEAYGVLRAARQSGVSIPEQLSLVGFADMDVSRICAPALTTSPMPALEIGRRVTRALLAAIDGETVASELVTTELVVRESTAAME
jgi:LacI family transcriptional regulator